MTGTDSEAAGIEPRYATRVVKSLSDLVAERRRAEVVLAAFVADGRNAGRRPNATCPCCLLRFFRAYNSPFSECWICRHSPSRRTASLAQRALARLKSQ